jgi:hypothetical protein
MHAHSARPNRGRRPVASVIRPVMRQRRDAALGARALVRELSISPLPDRLFSDHAGTEEPMKYMLALLAGRIPAAGMGAQSRYRCTPGRGVVEILLADER